MLLSGCGKMAHFLLPFLTISKAEGFNYKYLNTSLLEGVPLAPFMELFALWRSLIECILKRPILPLWRLAPEVQQRRSLGADLDTGSAFCFVSPPRSTKDSAALKPI